jgi:hypothetical protein
MRPALFEFGDVVLVPFPSTNQASPKQRPAVKPVFATLTGVDQAALKTAIAEILG